MGNFLMTFAERNLNPKTACLKRREEEKSEEAGAGSGSKFINIHGHMAAAGQSNVTPIATLDAMTLSKLVRNL